MARTGSTMLELGTTLPSFSLLEPSSGRTVSDADFEDRRALVVMFICNHCPYVQRIRDGLASLGRDYEDGEVGLVAISSNDAAAYPDDSPEQIAAEVERFDYRFPYLFDAEQEVAKRFRAACTPEFYVFGSDKRLVYRGQFDDARPGNQEPTTGRDVRAAIQAILSGAPLQIQQVPSVGCNIKWRAGNAPDYFG